MKSLANQERGVAWAEDGIGVRASSFSTLTLFYHVFLRIIFMLMQFLCVLVFPETDHWGRDEFFKILETSISSQTEPYHLCLGGAQGLEEGMQTG